MIASSYDPVPVVDGRAKSNANYVFRQREHQRSAKLYTQAWATDKRDSSDAEAGVLADYVVALVATDDSEANIQRNCIESLVDFLGVDNTAAFVKDVIVALKEKSYLPKPTTANAPIQSIVGSTNFEYEPHPSNVPSGAPRGPAATRNQQDGSNQSRKRKVLEGDDSHSWEAQDPHYNRNGTGNRPAKQAARRGGKNTSSRGGMEAQNPFAGFASMPNFANLPPPPPGPLPFDLSDPMALFAMAAAFGANLPGMPSLPFPNAQGKGSNQQDGKTKCIQYHQNGYCPIGSLCQYEHDDDAVELHGQVPEYDPEQSHLAIQPNGGARSRGQHRTTRGGRTRSKFPPSGRTYDPSNTTIVVDHIPEPDCNEDSVRNYFSEFGNILEVEMHADKYLAIIKFADRSAAKRAKNSPKAVFENRFVKVYWHTPDVAEDLATRESEKLDLEAIAIKQAEAQKAFEERRRNRKEAAARAAEIDRQLQEKNEEIEDIKRQLAELAGEDPNDFSQTLETLQREAEELFVQHGAREYTGPGRGRGAYRGHRGFAPLRGSYRGRGRGFTALGRSAVKRLDNRPRRLAVADIEANTPRDEALRQHLLNNPDCTNITRHPQDANTLILTFKERYQAEMFLDESLTIPDVGKLELAWVPNDAFGGLEAFTTTTVTSGGNDAARGDDDGHDDDDDGNDGNGSGGHQQQLKQEEQQMGSGGADADMDVADDVDQWM
ncbi:ccch zinc finger and rrm domain-containing [Pyrenophora seminiperda CCB06]|uniref:Ccch zinc finger and rrm domain-containing n=1 Tax=Pyrenophora seminiperda CCB06 TaxID=1302712 RepID=A0A3M7MBK5_9PLEO|nr:ccch zinc finger and rrm domain-containing [Pyrenophora seminiperda CCB06]